jgi:hypothetical protein
MKSFLAARITILLATALILNRLFYAQFETVIGRTGPWLVGLTLLLVTVCMGTHNLRSIFRLNGAQRVWSAAAVVATLFAVYAWFDADLGDRYVDWMSIPNEERHVLLAQMIESGKLIPEANGTVNLPPEHALPKLGLDVSVRGVAPDARVEIPLREIGSTVLLAVYEPRPVLRLDEYDRFWWRRISKKSAHWYLVLWADWD